MISVVRQPAQSSHRRTLPAGRIGNDTGSVTPLIIGMLLCLLLLGAGVTATGSAFMARQRIRHICDGAAAASAAAAPDNLSGDTTAALVDGYLALRDPAATAIIQPQPTLLILRCTTTSTITFGALFGSPTITQTVTSSARTVRNLNPRP